MQNKISFFQLDNLINNRVPFFFYNMSESIAPWYTSVTRMHVQTYETLISSDSVLNNLIEKNAPKDYAIVLLCRDGKESEQLMFVLEKNAYTNVYVVNGGYQQIVTERAQS
jgi:rhodanese-related sulfurtransferase